MTSVLALIVLYRRSCLQSEAFQSLAKLLAADRRLSERIRLDVADNSPTVQQPPESFAGLYQRYPHNPGLAAPYQDALSRAAQDGIPWLMVLDQDTTVTHAYLEEVLTAIDETSAVPPQVGVLVPRLVEAGAICSPALPPRLGPARRVGPALHGVAPVPLIAFNSGAVFRVESLAAIGGFPQEFPLDYLDHATFALLQRAEKTMWILRSELEHQLSSNRTTRASAAEAAREMNVLRAEQRFYELYGSAADRILRRLRLLRAAAGRVLRRQPWDKTRRLLGAALRP